MSPPSEELRVFALYTTALIAVLFWDYLNTLYTEVKYVWRPMLSANQRRQWRTAGAENRAYMILSPVLFVVVRYFALAQASVSLATLSTRAETMSMATCRRIQRFLPIGAVVIGLAACAMMTLRVIALWENRRSIKWPLFCLYSATTALCVWSVTEDVGYSETNGGMCAPSAAPVQADRRIGAYYVAIAAFDAIIVALTLLRVVLLRRASNGATGRLVGIMLRDGFVYFTFIFAANVLAAAFQLQSVNADMRPINAPLATIMTSIFSSRVYFNIRAEVYKLREPKAHFACYANEAVAIPAAAQRRDSDRTVIDNRSGDHVAAETSKFDSYKLPPLPTLTMPAPAMAVNDPFSALDDIGVQAPTLEQIRTANETANDYLHHFDPYHIICEVIHGDDHRDPR